ncbi:MAG: KH domain-containing protein [candidate division WOR-3 bacterium]|nr:KH domain-containing protein [candidate division WOR-3 bacterium]MCX7836489.1 KH domain-containing protein [candidate division WOR-3 bacterium]MDW8114532.1 KH domain-containing protein [candidate division WOR-3 bacterium]
MMSLKELLENITKAIVDNPDQVQLKEIAGERTVLFELRVGQGDLGKIIGKEGRTAKALRQLLAAAAMKQGKRAQLEILE